MTAWALLGTALACQCGWHGLADVTWSAQRAPLVFEGRVVAVHLRNPNWHGGSGFYEVEVVRWWRGDLPERVTLVSAGSEACEPTPAFGAEGLFIVSGEPVSELRFSMCGAVAPSAWAGLLGPPIGERSLGPGPADAYREALASCDLEAIVAARAAGIRPNAEPPPLHCRAAVLAAWVDGARIPSAMVADADADALATLVEQIPASRGQALKDAVALGRDDLVARLHAQRPLSPDEAAATALIWPPAVDVLLGPARDPAVLQDVLDRASSPTAGRLPAHGDVAVRLLAAGARPSGWSEFTANHALMAGYPAAELDRLLAVAPPGLRLPMEREAALMLAELGEVDALTARWRRVADPALAVEVAERACPRGLGAVAEVARITGVDPPSCPPTTWKPPPKPDQGPYAEVFRALAAPDPIPLEEGLARIRALVAADVPLGDLETVLHTELRSWRAPRELFAALRPVVRQPPWR